jgi:uncharacterized protein YkwD
MLESEIKKLRETIESLQTTLLSLASNPKPLGEVSTHSNTLTDIEAAKAKTADLERQMLGRVESPAPSAPAPSAPAPSAPAPSAPAPSAPAPSAPAPSAPAPSAPGPTGALTELQAYASNLVAQYSARTGSPETTMGIVAQYGITNIATASDELLTPFVTAMKTALGE